MKNFKFIMFSMLFLFIASCTIAPESGQYAVESDYFDGELTVWNGPGMKDAFNIWDDVAYYDKENMYSFSHDLEEGRAIDESIYVKFADFGEANISGTVRYALPTNSDKMQKLHENYDSQEGIEKELIRQAIERAVYLSGPLMTSQESNGSKRAELLSVIMDQAQDGIYMVKTVDEKVMDVATGKEKTIKISRPVKCDPGTPNCVGQYRRAEPSALNDYGVKLYNFTVKRIEYSGPVKEQIQKQQQMNMAMEELTIKAKQSQTEAITTVENAKAEVALVNAQRDKSIAEAQAATAVAKEKLAQKKFEIAGTLAEKEAEAKASRLKVQAGLDPLKAAEIEKQRAIGIMEQWAKRPVPMIDNRSTGGGKSGGLEEAIELKELMLMLDRTKSKN